MKINPKDIKEAQILNVNLRREHEDDKQGILDVFIKDVYRADLAGLGYRQNGVLFHRASKVSNGA